MVNMGCRQQQDQQQEQEQKPSLVPSSGTELQVFMKSTTYLAKIALTLQGVPDKMLTFSQLMHRLAPLFPEDTKSVEVNIRVCLSSNKCFVKIPLTPGSQNSKKNYWKLDTQQITEKMVRRHFRGMLKFFPELASKIQTHHQPAEGGASVCSPEVACKVKYEVRFSGPFSIESILRRDSPPVRTHRPSPLSTVPFTTEQQPGLSHIQGTKRTYSCITEELDPSSGPYPVWPVEGSTHHGLYSPGAAKLPRRAHVSSEPSFPMYETRASAGPWLSSPHNTYSAPIRSQRLFRSWV
ncbi:hypothetical protein WMY93_019522 [Mugilogobius chulae]|uniref:Fork-head domain-containing protein n=1 Tax=Mugilogobius chulae TaxID=88201 RepID=A0AAW0NRM9_9GOBI